MKIFFDHLCNITKIFAGVLLCAMTIMVGVGIGGRYLSMSVPWADELARIFFIWSSLMGAASATHKKMHFSVSFLTSYFGKCTRRKLDLLSSILIISVMTFILFASIGFLNIAKIQILPALQISKVPYQLAVILSSILIIIFIINHIIEEYIKIRN